MSQYAWLLAPLLTIAGVAITNLVTFSFRAGKLVQKVEDHDRRIVILEDKTGVAKAATVGR